MILIPITRIVNLNEQWRNLPSLGFYLYYSAERRRSFLFGTVENMDRLAHLVINGTFSTSPNLFTQLVTIHGLYPEGWRIPLAFGLLPGKTQAHY